MSITMYQDIPLHGSMARRAIMARNRYNDHELEALKRNVSILHVCAAHGIELKRHGTGDYVGRCPFHEEDNRDGRVAQAYSPEGIKGMNATAPAVAAYKADLVSKRNALPAEINGVPSVSVRAARIPVLVPSSPTKEVTDGREATTGGDRTCAEPV